MTRRRKSLWKQHRQIVTLLTRVGQRERELLRFVSIGSHQMPVVKPTNNIGKRQFKTDRSIFRACRPPMNLIDVRQTRSMAQHREEKQVRSLVITTSTRKFNYNWICWIVIMSKKNANITHNSFETRRKQYPSMMWTKNWEIKYVFGPIARILVCWCAVRSSSRCLRRRFDTKKCWVSGNKDVQKFMRFVIEWANSISSTKHSTMPCPPLKCMIFDYFFERKAKAAALLDGFRELKTDEDKHWQQRTSLIDKHSTLTHEVQELEQVMEIVVWATTTDLVSPRRNLHWKMSSVTLNGVYFSRKKT